MNKLIKNLGLALLVLSTYTLSAQNVPGYMGKRLAVGYSTLLALNLFEGNYNSSKPSDRELFFGFSNQHYITAEYVISKRLSLTGGLGYSKAYFAPDEIQFNSSIQWDERPGTNMLAFVGGLRIYTNHLAPVGGFAEFYVGYQNINPDDFTYTSLSSASPEEFTITPASTGSFLAGLKFGRSMVIVDQFKFEYFGYMGFQTGGLGSSNIFLGVYGDAGDFFDTDFSLGNTENNQRIFEEGALGRMWASHILGFGMTFSFLN